MPLSRRTTREPRRSRRGKSVDSVHGAFRMKRAIIIAPYIAARAHPRDRRTATQRVRNDRGRLVRVARKCRCGRPPAKGFRLRKFTMTMLLTISFDSTLSAASDLPFPRRRWLDRALAPSGNSVLPSKFLSCCRAPRWHSPLARARRSERPSPLQGVSDGHFPSEA